MMLADVSPGQYLLIEGKTYWFDGYVNNPAIGNPCTLLLAPSGLSRHITLKKARKIEVERMELLPKWCLTPA